MSASDGVVRGSLRAIGTTLRLSYKASAGASRAMRASMDGAQLRRGLRAARGGLLGPSDPAPTPEAGVDFYDYRGVARVAELQLEEYAYPLGRPREPSKRWRLAPYEIGLPPRALA